MKVVEWVRDYWFQILLMLIIFTLLFCYFYFGSLLNPDFWTPTNLTGIRDLDFGCCPLMYIFIH